MPHILDFRNWNMLYESGAQAKPNIVPVTQTGVNLVIFSAPGQGWQAPNEKPYILLGNGDLEFTGAASEGKTISLRYRASNDAKQGATRSMTGTGEDGDSEMILQTNSPNLVEGTNILYQTAEALYGIGNVDVNAVKNTLATLFYIKTKYPIAIESAPLAKSVMSIAAVIFNLGSTVQDANFAFKTSPKNTSKSPAPKTFATVYDGVKSGFDLWKKMKG